MGDTTTYLDLNQDPLHVSGIVAISADTVR
jgi:hypothetical protein